MPFRHPSRPGRPATATAALLCLLAGLAGSGCRSEGPGRPESAAEEHAAPRPTAPLEAAEQAEVPSRADDSVNLVLADFERGTAEWTVDADRAEGASLPVLELSEDTHVGEGHSLRFRVVDEGEHWHFARLRVDGSTWPEDASGLCFYLKGDPDNATTRQHVRLQLRETDGDIWDVRFGEDCNVADWRELRFSWDDFRLRGGEGDGQLVPQQIEQVRLYASYFESGAVELLLDDLSLIPATPAD